MFSKYSQLAIEWYRKVAFIPSKAPIFFSGLIIIHGVVEYSMLSIFITHLTNDWAVNLPKAAQMVNVHEGLSSILVIVVSQLSDCFFGRLYVILFTHTAFILWLDKAAILEPSPLLSIEQAENAGRLVEVAKVKDVKRLMSMFPLWSTFFVYSLVGATANTFFYEQANIMDDHLGKISHVPVVIFVIIKTFTSSVVSHICQSLKSAVGSTGRPPLRRTTFGMLCSFLCCLVAWWAEKYRHDGMEIWVDEDNEEFYVNEMSVFWLIPQFLLVGLMDGLSSSGFQDIFETQVSDSMKGYEPEFTEFFSGIGKFVSVIFILIFRSWFKEDVNTSRLDKYYPMLMVPTFLNLLFCWFVCSWYVHQPYFDITIDNAQQSEAGAVEVLTNENSGIDTAKRFEDGVIEVLTNENSSFDIAQELEDGIIEILTNENSSSTPSTNN